MSILFALKGAEKVTSTMHDIAVPLDLTHWTTRKDDDNEVKAKDSLDESNSVDSRDDKEALNQVKNSQY